MWLRDLLPNQLFAARIMVFGYGSPDGGLASLLSVEGLTRAAEDLLQALMKMRIKAEASLPSTCLQIHRPIEAFSNVHNPGTNTSNSFHGT